MLTRAAAVLMLAFVSSSALAQFEMDQTPAAAGGGVGMIAVENKAGQGILVEPSNGFAKGIKFGGGLTSDTITLETDDTDFELKRSGPHAEIMAPLGNSGFGLGFAAAVMDTEVELEFTDDEITTSLEDIENDSSTTHTYIEAIAAYSTNTMTFGLALGSMQYKYSSTSSYRDAETGTKYESEYEDNERITTIKLGVAFRPAPSARLAMTFRPKVVKKYQSKNTDTTTASDGTVTVEESHDPELLSVGHQLRLGGAFDIGKVTLLTGVDRQFPFTATPDKDEDEDEADPEENEGSTIVSFGAQVQVVPVVILRGNLHNYAAAETKGQGIGFGADFKAGPVELSPAVVIDSLEIDGEDGDDDTEIKRTHLSFGIGATL